MNKYAHKISMFFLLLISLYFFFELSQINVFANPTPDPATPATPSVPEYSYNDMTTFVNDNSTDGTNQVGGSGAINDAAKMGEQKIVSQASKAVVIIRIIISAICIIVGAILGVRLQIHGNNPQKRALDIAGIGICVVAIILSTIGYSIVNTLMPKF